MCTPDIRGWRSWPGSDAEPSATRVAPAPGSAALAPARAALAAAQEVGRVVGRVTGLIRGRLTVGTEADPGQGLSPVP